MMRLVSMHCGARGYLVLYFNETEVIEKTKIVLLVIDVHINDDLLDL